MRVLLISPLHGLDPPCGDITYTETLVAHPPEGVVYETYADALRRGTLIEHGRRERFWKEPLLTACSKAINLLRKSKQLFWEPFRFFSVVPGEYDLIHLHVFNARFFSLPCPLIISSGAPQKDLYLNNRQYTPVRVCRLQFIDKILGQALRVNCNSSYMPQAHRVLVYTEYFRDYLVNDHYVEADRVSVVPILSIAPSFKLTRRVPRRIGFVARNFDEKGGPVVLDAFKQVRQQYPDTELWIIGSKPQLAKDKAARMGITWLDCVPRDQLLKEIMPSFDVFAYPTPHDCFSYVLLEAMSCGVAIATSDYVSMPEAVSYGKAGLISPVGDAGKLAKNILTLINPETNWTFRQAALKRFEEYFSWQAVAPRILEEYQKAMTDCATAKPVETQ